MDKTLKRQKIRRIAAVAAISVLPLAMVVIALDALVGDTRITATFLLTSFVIPAAAFFLCLMGLRKGRRTVDKVIGCVGVTLGIALLELIVIAFGCYVRFSSYEGTEALEQYRVRMNSIAEMPVRSHAGTVPMPTEDELGEYDEAEFYRSTRKLVIFIEECDTLICRYDEEAYYREKANVEKRLSFEHDIIRGKYDEKGHEPVIALEGFNISFLEFNEYPALSYPSQMVFVGFNDESYEIAYICYYDQDMDMISDTERFILESCGWKYMID